MRIIKCNFYFIDAVASVCPSSWYTPLSPYLLFHVPRSSSIKLTVTQTQITKIAQPNYMTAPKSPCSSLFSFKGFTSIFMLQSPINICPRILPPPSLEFTSTWKCSSLRGYFFRDVPSLHKLGPGCNIRWKCEVLRDTFSQWPAQHPAVMVRAPSVAGSQW